MDSGTSSGSSNSNSSSTSSIAATSDISISPMGGITGGRLGASGGGAKPSHLFGLSGLDCKGFKQLLDTQSLVDCTLACDGGKVSAHKIVLSACSSYLAKILLEHPVEHPIIILPELGIEDVRTLIHYMYTGDLLKSSTINSISLLRTAAILSINSLNDLMLASKASAPTSPATSQHFTTSDIHQQQQQQQQQQHQVDQLQQQLLTNGNLLSQPALIAQQQQQRNISLVEQISPLLAAISQQHQYKLQLQQFNRLTGNLQAENLMSQSRNNSASSQASSSNLSAGESSFSSIMDALGAAATSNSNSAANYYNSLTNHLAISHAPSSLTSSSGSGSGSASSSPNNNNNTLQLQNQPHKPEPFAYSSAITGTTTTSVLGASGGGNSSSTSASATTGEFQFKCPTCQNHFQTICSFEYHMQRVHSVTSFGCEICHKPFASLRYVLTDHMRRCHGWKTGGTSNSTASNLINSQQQQQQQQASGQQQPQRRHHQKVECL